MGSDDGGSLRQVFGDAVAFMADAGIIYFIVFLACLDLIFSLAPCVFLECYFYCDGGEKLGALLFWRVEFLLRVFICVT